MTQRVFTKANVPLFRPDSDDEGNGSAVHVALFRLYGQDDTDADNVDSASESSEDGSIDSPDHKEPNHVQRQLLVELIADRSELIRNYVHDARCHRQKAKSRAALVLLHSCLQRRFEAAQSRMEEIHNERWEFAVLERKLGIYRRLNGKQRPLDDSSVLRYNYGQAAALPHRNRLRRRVLNVLQEMKNGRRLKD